MARTQAPLIKVESGDIEMARIAGDPSKDPAHREILDEDRIKLA